MTRILETADSARERELIQTDIQAFLDRNLQKELLRFTTVGSVDDGKSTLIGRLLHDTKGVYDDQLKDATRTSSTGEAQVDFARLTDGLRAEREQGITIDVAYRYFSTPRRKFIIADTPGHVQYTRNMATGASTANVALILIDARLGVLEQSRRHGYIAALLGIPHLLVCVNKMDLVAYDQARFDEIAAEFKAFTDPLGFRTVDFLPISALLGVNIVHRSPDSTPWYPGPSVLEYLETVEIRGDIELGRFRFPVQLVLRPDLHYRGFAGQVASGVVRVGDEITVLPSGKTTRVTHIDTYEGELEEAFAPMSVTLRLADEIDISRGDLIVASQDPPLRGRRVDAMVVWLNEAGMDLGKTYLMKHTSRVVRTGISAVAWKVRLETLEHVPSEGLTLNEIGLVHLDVHADLCFDPYRQNRPMGAFILIDSLSNTTVAAGMLIGRTDAATGADDRAPGISQVSPTERRLRLGHPSAILALDGLDPEARLRVAYAVERRLFDLGALPAVAENVGSATLLANAGLVAILPDPAEPHAAVRLEAGDADEERLEATADRLASRVLGR